MNSIYHTGKHASDIGVEWGRTQLMPPLELIELLLKSAARGRQHTARWQQRISVEVCI